VEARTPGAVMIGIQLRQQAYRGIPDTLDQVFASAEYKAIVSDQAERHRQQETQRTGTKRKRL